MKQMLCRMWLIKKAKNVMWRVLNPCATSVLKSTTKVCKISYLHTQLSMTYIHSGQCGHTYMHAHAEFHSSLDTQWVWWVFMFVDNKVTIAHTMFRQLTKRCQQNVPSFSQGELEKWLLLSLRTNVPSNF